jgi:galactoside O-acetyltransferase
MKLLKILISEILNFLTFFIIFCPGKIGIFFRKVFFKIMFKELGENFYSEIGLFVTGHENIVIKNNCTIMRSSSINADKNSSIKIGDNISVNYNVNINSCNNGHIEIGNDVLIGQNTVLRASDHKISDQNKKINQQSHIGGKIIVGNNVWIGANCVILKDVTIEDNSIIGAGVVISKDVKKNEIVVGEQHRILKKRI